MQMAWILGLVGMLATVVGGAVFSPLIFRIGLGTSFAALIWSLCYESDGSVVAICLAVALLMPLLALALAKMLIWFTWIRVKCSDPGQPWHLPVQLASLEKAYERLWNLAGSTDSESVD